VTKYILPFLPILRLGVWGSPTATQFYLKVVLKFISDYRAMNSYINKPEIVQLVLRLSFISVCTFFTMKWLLKQLDPTNAQKKAAAKKAKDVLQRLGLDFKTEFSEYELTLASNLIDPDQIDVDWSYIGGHSDVVREIRENVIIPITKKKLFINSRLSRPPIGILLHGPPGCGKTMIAKATAKEAGTRFINLDLSALTDKWYGESQKLAAALFTLANKVQPCIIFIDEIDSFLRNRNVNDHEVTAMVKAEFMKHWDGFLTDSQNVVIVMGATNRPADLDDAILRRMTAKFHIPLPNQQQRLEILQLILSCEECDDTVDFERLASMTVNFCGSDLREMCRKAALYRCRDFIGDLDSIESIEALEKKKDEEQKMRPISMQDLLAAFAYFEDSYRSLRNH